MYYSCLHPGALMTMVVIIQLINCQNNQMLNRPIAWILSDCLFSYESDGHRVAVDNVGSHELWQTIHLEMQTMMINEGVFHPNLNSEQQYYLGLRVPTRDERKK
jgi:hypothetical protein